MLQACMSEFKTDGNWGFEKVASIAEIKKRDSGFLTGEGFVVKVEIRLKLRGNERCSLSVDKNTATYTV